MSSYTTPTWGYKLLSGTQINFYHVLLPKVSLETLQSAIPYTTNIRYQRDGSILISVSSPEFAYKVVRKIITFFEKKAQDFLDTPNYYYKVDKKLRQSLLPWALSFEGCLSLLLQHDQKIKECIEGEWQFINSRVGGIFLAPFTVLLYTDHAKVIHPTTVQNYEARKTIEQQTALHIRKMIKRIKESQPGLEGIALLSLVESQTRLSPKEITKVINEKSFRISSPTHCPFFSA